MGSEVRLCKTCVFWQHDSMTSGSFWSGWCFRHPPSLPTEKGDVGDPENEWWENRDRYPRTHRDDVCGEWRHLKDEQLRKLDMPSRLWEAARQE